MRNKPLLVFALRQFHWIIDDRDNIVWEGFLNDKATPVSLLQAAPYSVACYKVQEAQKLITQKASNAWTAKLEEI